MYRTLVIVRHTFLEAVVQPIYTLVLAIGIAIIVVFGLLPFFTFGEDTLMFKSVCLDVVLLLVLISTLFATSKSIYEEIEDRTMLTLMSKPVQRGEVLIGKYLGLVLAAFLGVPNTLSQVDFKMLWDLRVIHVTGLVMSLLLMWLQICVLAAISVAISTRVSLIVNLPLVILIYIAGNMTRFLFPMDAPGAVLADKGPFVQGLAYVVSTILPYLATFDLRQLTVFKMIAVEGTGFERDPNAVSVTALWLAVSAAAAYAVCYTTAALGAGMLLFQTRELGGAEG
jgi:ABC-type transport system involved in multi-copper enzyme maturation permease subunit